MLLPQLADQVNARFGFEAPIKLAVHQHEIDAAVFQRLAQVGFIIRHGDRHACGRTADGAPQIARIRAAMSY